MAETKFRTGGSESRVDVSPGRHVSEQAESPRQEVETKPCFKDTADRGDQCPACQPCTQGQCDHRRSETRVLACVHSERQPVQPDQLLAEPPSGSAAGDLFQQITYERLSRPRGFGASQEPQRKSGADHVHPSWTGMPRHSTVSAFFAALTSRNPAVVIEKYRLARPPRSRVG